MENLTPEGLFILVGGCIAVVIVQFAWAYRDTIGGWFTARRTVPSAFTAPPAYGKQPASAAIHDRDFPLPAWETDADADADDAREAAPPLPVGALIISEVELQARIEAAAEQARAETFGRLLGAGFLDTMTRDKRTTEAKALVFGTSGRVLTRVKPIIDREAQRCTPAVAPQLTPIVGRETSAEFQTLRD